MATRGAAKPAAKSPGAKSPRAYLLWGQEELRKRQALAELIDQLVPPEDRDLDVEHVDAGNSGVTGESIIHAARDRAMFSERRVVVVWNAGRFRQSRHQRTQDQLAQALPTLPDYSTIIFVANAEDGEGRRGAPFGEKLMAALKAHGQVRQFPLLKPEELARLAQEEAAAAGKKLAPAAAALLANRAGPDSNRVLQETRKLIAYVGDAPGIAPRDVELMVPAPPDDNIFHLLDTAMDGNRRQALGVLRQLRESGMAVPQIMTMLARTLRQVTQAKLLAERGVPPEADAESVPADVRAMLPEDGFLYASARSDWQRKKIWGQAKRMSWPRLQQALGGLAATDAGTKGWEFGVEDPDLALELFVSALCDAVQPAPAASRWR